MEEGAGRGEARGRLKKYDWWRIFLITDKLFETGCCYIVKQAKQIKLINNN